jgi:hypothetical protein
MEPILTLNGRGHLLFPKVRDLFDLTNSQMRAEILTMQRTTIASLAAKKISYRDLRSGLTPTADRNEAAFIFDSSVVESRAYGQEVMRHVLPLLDPRTTQSVLCGDLLGQNQQLIHKILNESMVLTKSFEFRHSALLFCVYVNNLSDAVLKSMHERLPMFAAYLGHIPTTFASRAKVYLSTTLVNVFLKNGKKIILAHEDDRSDEENVNLLGYPFEEHGYEIFSLQSTHFDIFLSFKIERPIFPGHEDDANLSLNAISNTILPLHDFVVVLEEAKHGYLVSNKLGKLEKAGLASLNRDELACLIKSKVTANYIYNMLVNEHNVMKFNLMLEIERKDGGFPTRLMVGLEYSPNAKVLRVITMY